ncbi:MAG: hypothetical protein ACKVX7_13815, partial [Planctomycetota bacterium]
RSRDVVDDFGARSAGVSPALERTSHAMGSSRAARSGGAGGTPALPGNVRTRAGRQASKTAEFADAEQVVVVVLGRELCEIDQAHRAVEALVKRRGVLKTLTRGIEQFEKWSSPRHEVVKRVVDGPRLVSLSEPTKVVRLSRREHGTARAQILDARERVDPRAGSGAAVEEMFIRSRTPLPRVRESL